MTTEPDEIDQPEISERSLLQKCCEELALSEPRAIEVLQWSEENFTVPVKQASPVSYKVSLDKIFRLLKTAENPRLAILIMGYALGLDEAMEFGYPTKFARLCGCTKANANKLLKKYQFELQLPQRQGQRNDEARKTMSEKRKEQLK